MPRNTAGSLKRLNNLTRKMNQTELIKPDGETIQRHKQEGIIKDASNLPSGTEFYIPHKPVIREAAESTKLRIVYDASAWAHSEEPSLNDCLNAGPPLQNLLWDVLVRFRFHPVALTGDLKKVFLKWERRTPLLLEATRWCWSRNFAVYLSAVWAYVFTLFIWRSYWASSGVVEDRMPAKVKALRDSMYVDDLIICALHVRLMKSCHTEQLSWFQ